MVIRWHSARASHTERMVYPAVDPSSMELPGKLGEGLSQPAVASTVEQSFPPGSLLEKTGRTVILPIENMLPPGPGGAHLTPRRGRFYPSRLFAAGPGFNPQASQPLRVIDVDPASLTLELDHPLADRELEIELLPYAAAPGKSTGAVARRDPFGELLASGIGLQKPLAHGTDFYHQGAFDRHDPMKDMVFYRQQRMVAHIDQSASEEIAHIYGRDLQPGMRVLDLMSSWQSHLPADIESLNVTGLGMNRAELDANPRLEQRLVHDLNQDSRLPFADNSFDVTLCSLSIEYLIDPLSVLREVVRVTRPGGRLVVSFSNRCFPSKAIALWNELHPFERVGLVLDLFLRTGGLVDVETESLQGQPRDADDLYAGQLAQGDPVFVVAATVSA